MTCAKDNVFGIQNGAEGVQFIYPLIGGKKEVGPRALACSKHHLGTINLPRQSKVEVDWDCFPPCLTLRCRDAWISAYATICGPEDIVGGLVNDVIECVTAGAVAATLSLIIGNPAAALPAFEVAFKGCLATKIGERVKEISVSLSTEQGTGDWGAC